MSDYKTPKNKLIDAKQAAALNSAYIAERLPIIEKSLGISDHASFWYSLEDLEGYIGYVKEQAKAKEIALDGVRVYLGVYPEDYANSSKSGHATVFMCPTTASRNGNSDDVEEIAAFNYGDIGNPPQLIFGE